MGQCGAAMSFEVSPFGDARSISMMIGRLVALAQVDHVGAGLGKTSLKLLHSKWELFSRHARCVAGEPISAGSAPRIANFDFRCRPYLRQSMRMS
jgi:hypothetical protein